MIEALFLDRDGVINEIVRRGDVVGSPRNLDELKIREEFVLFYKKIEDLGIPLFVVSNQPDVRRGLMAQNDLDAITKEMKSRFPKLQFSYCIHDDRDQCPCRKPKPGMILDLVRTYGLNKEKALLIGDSGKDIEAGRAAGVRTMLLRTDYNRQYHSHSTIGRLCEIVL